MNSPEGLSPSGSGTTVTGVQDEGGTDLSLFQLSAILLRNRWRIVGCMIVFGGLAAALTWRRPPRYEASAAFIPQSSSSSTGGLSGLAGQLGLALPAENRTESPEFYVQLLTSRAILLPIVLDTFLVPEFDPRPTPFLDLVKVRPESDLIRHEEGIEVLRNLVKATRDANTGTVLVSVTTAWPTASATLVAALIEGVADFNQQTRRGQAAVERQFIQERLAIASAELRSAEDRLSSFMSNNRLIEASPQLIAEKERLQRDITLDQQVFTTLTQAHEEARIREVRATPIITVLEEPMLPALPEPRGRIRNTVVGALIGGLGGAVLALMAELLRQVRQANGADALALDRELRDVKRQLFGWTRIFRRSE